MRKFFQSILFFVISVMSPWTLNSWAIDSTSVIKPNITSMTFAPSVTPVVQTVPISSSAAPNDAICSAGYTLTSLKYKDSAGNYAYQKFHQPTGTCDSTSSSDTNYYGSGMTYPACPGGTSEIGNYCDENCNTTWGGPAGGYCDGFWSYGCRYKVCRTTTCTSTSASWVPSSSVLPGGANGSTTNALEFKEAICTQGAIWRPVQ